MHRKRVFTIAAVFLVIALVVPPVFVVLAVNNTTLYKYLVPGTSPVQGSPTGITTILVTSSERQAYLEAVIIAAAIEIVFIALFLYAMYYGINHTHPEH